MKKGGETTYTFSSSNVKYLDTVSETVEFGVSGNSVLFGVLVGNLLLQSGDSAKVHNFSVGTRLTVPIVIRVGLRCRREIVESICYCCNSTSSKLQQLGSISITGTGRATEETNSLFEQVGDVIRLSFGFYPRDIDTPPGCTRYRGRYIPRLFDRCSSCERIEQ